MNSINTFFDTEFDSLRADWERALMNELKLSEVGSKAHKKLLGGANWPTLSLERRHEVSLTPGLHWKKASTTYTCLPEDGLEKWIADDLTAGVRNFFFHGSALDAEKWARLENVFASFGDSKDIEVFLLGEGFFSSPNVKVINTILSGKEAHDEGGSSIQELAFLCKKMIASEETQLTIGVFVDTQFFHNIAKIRAARLLAEKILEEKEKKGEVRIVALTSYRSWTLFERYSNMLRNETSVASAYIGGADHIQSAGYNALLELETSEMDGEHFERSQRMARNTTHILALESMLGVVEDAAFGSYHLESLTNSLCEESWKLMQKLLRGEELSLEITKIRNERLERIKTRKTIISGINDFPDRKETLGLSLGEPFLFRETRIFEELRLKMSKLKKPEVYVALFGDYAALNARMNFVKNYFELLGLTVHDSGKSQLDSVQFKKELDSRSESILVFCSLDDQYQEISEVMSHLKRPHLYVAGKVEVPGYKNLYAGQNVYEVLFDLVKSVEGGHSK